MNLEVRILNELRVRFVEVRIVKQLGRSKGFRQMPYESGSTQRTVAGAHEELGKRELTLRGKWADMEQLPSYFCPSLTETRTVYV
jgi:hypothetical protein